MPEITAKELESKRLEELAVLAESPKLTSSKSPEVMALAMKKLSALLKPRLLKRLQEKKRLQNTAPKK